MKCKVCKLSTNMTVRGPGGVLLAMCNSCKSQKNAKKVIYNVSMVWKEGEQYDRNE